MIQKKMTVNATDDSYDKARQSMAQAEEETRSRGAIVIKHGGRYQGTVKKKTPKQKYVAMVTQEGDPPEDECVLMSTRKKSTVGHVACD